MTFHRYRLSRSHLTEQVLEDVPEAVDELNMELSVKLKGRNADDLLNEL